MTILDSTNSKYHAKTNILQVQTQNKQTDETENSRNISKMHCHKML